MPINMTDYRMIINERVYNVLQIMIDFAGPLEEGEPPKPKFIDAVYIDEDGTIKTMRDEAWCFQFVRRNGGAADVIMPNTDNMPVFCRNQCANTKCAKHISKAYECGGSCSMRLLRGEPECAGYISRRKHK